MVTVNGSKYDSRAIAMRNAAIVDIGLNRIAPKPKTHHKKYDNIWDEGRCNQPSYSSVGSSDIMALIQGLAQSKKASDNLKPLTNNNSGSQPPVVNTPTVTIPPSDLQKALDTASSNGDPNAWKVVENQLPIAQETYNKNQEEIKQLNTDIAAATKARDEAQGKVDGYNKRNQEIEGTLTSIQNAYNEELSTLDFTKNAAIDTATNTFNGKISQADADYSKAIANATNEYHLAINNPESTPEQRATAEMNFTKAQTAAYEKCQQDKKAAADELATKKQAAETEYNEKAGALKKKYDQDVARLQDEKNYNTKVLIPKLQSEIITPKNTFITEKTQRLNLLIATNQQLSLTMQSAATALASRPYLKEGEQK